MSVISRTFKSTPARAADETWKAIAAFLVPGMDGPKYEELLSVCGVASSLIADQAPSSSPIIVTCEGPRTHIRCIYDDDAIRRWQGKRGPGAIQPAVRRLGNVASVSRRGSGLGTGKSIEDIFTYHSP